jgi:hypothetical protein
MVWTSIMTCCATCTTFVVVLACVNSCWETLGYKNAFNVVFDCFNICCKNGDIVTHKSVTVELNKPCSKFYNNYPVNYKGHRGWC